MTNSEGLYDTLNPLDCAGDDVDYFDFTLNRLGQPQLKDNHFRRDPKRPEVG